MKLKTKLMIICCGTLIVATLIIANVTRNSLITNESTSLKDDTQKTLYAFGLLIDESIKKRSSDLVYLSNNKTKGRLSDYGFHTALSIENKNKEFNQTWMDSIYDYPEGYGQVIFDKLELLLASDFQKEEVRLTTIDMIGGDTLLAMIVSKDKEFFIGIFENNFSDLVKKFVLDKSDFVFVNQETQLLASSTISKSYFDPLEEAIRDSKLSELIFYTEGSEEMVLSLKKLPSFNMYLAVMTPATVIYAKANEISKNILTIGFSFVLILIGLILAFAIKLSDNFRRVFKVIKSKNTTNQDEFSLISKSIENMRTSWQDKYRSLEEKTKSILKSERSDAFREYSSFISSKVTAPLSAAKGYLQIIKNKNTNPKLERFIKNQEEAINEVQGIVNRLSQFSKADISHKQLFDLNKIIEYGISLLDYRLDKVKLDISLGKPKPINANPLLLKQAFYNMFSNAINQKQSNELIIKTLTTDHKAQVVFRYMGSSTIDPVPNSDEGLDLASGIGIIEEHGGTFTQSIHENYVEVKIEFPLFVKTLFSETSNIQIEA